MIQLASDPTASRSNRRTGQAEGKSESLQPRRGRAGHAWPFISRQADKPLAQQPARKPSSEHGS
jgi:hypothetical protein